MIKNRRKPRISHKEGHKAELKGTFTVEASYVVPIIVIILILVMGYTIYLHDMIIMQTEAAHIAEEGRMGLNYGRIPYSSQIYQGGFQSEQEIEELHDFMVLYFLLNDSATMQGVSEIEEILLTEEESEVSMIYDSKLMEVLATGNKEQDKAVSQKREAANPCVYAAMTNLVYQIGKSLLID